MKFAVLSDIHANFEALSVVLDKCREEGVEKYICLGDIVGYNANPKDCLKMMRSLDMIGCVKGNHEHYVCAGDEVFEGVNQNARRSIEWTRGQLDEEEVGWLANLPMKVALKGANITIVHSTLDSPESWGYVDDIHKAIDNFSYQFTSLCFCGHSHVPNVFCKKAFAGYGNIAVEEMLEWKSEGMENPVISLQKGWKYLINIGSVGQPRNRDTRASFAIYDSEKNTVVRHRLSYDIASTQCRIREAGLPEHLAVRLQIGS